MALLLFLTSGEAIVVHDDSFQIIFTINLFFLALGEAILGTHDIFQNHYTIICFLASGEAILGARRYLPKQFSDYFFSSPLPLGTQGYFQIDSATDLVRRI